MHYYTKVSFKTKLKIFFKKIKKIVKTLPDKITIPVSFKKKYKKIDSKLDLLNLKCGRVVDRVVEYLKKLLFPIYLFPIKLVTFTLHFIFLSISKVLFTWARMLLDAIKYPFSSLRNFFKSILIITFISYFLSTYHIARDYVKNEYGSFEKYACRSYGTNKKLKNSVVRVVGGYMEGSGFFVGPSKIVTNFHVITGEPSPKIIFPDGSFTTPYKILGDKELDIAVLYINEVHFEKQFEWMPVDELIENETLYAAGYPGGTIILGEPTVLKGKYLTVRSSKSDPVMYVHTDISLAGGMSGGPLVDRCGNVVGINTFALSGNSLFISSKTFEENYRSLTDDDITKIYLNPSDSPEESVKAFYTYLKVRDMEKGFNLLSEEYLKKTDFNEWTNRFTDIIDVYIYETKKADWPPNTVYVRFKTKNWDGEEVNFHFYEGTWETIFEDGVYKMLMADIVEVDKPNYKWFWSSN